MLINIRGANGSGKSFVVRELMKLGPVSEFYGELGSRRPEAYELLLPQVDTSVFILGSYDNQCGGCDLFKNPKQLIRLIKTYAARGHVLFEGAMVSTMYGSVGEALEAWGRDVVFIFLDTPLVECMRRIEDRLAERSRGRLLHNMRIKFLSIEDAFNRIVAEDKMRVTIASPEKAIKLILDLLQQPRLVQALVDDPPIRAVLTASGRGNGKHVKKVKSERLALQLLSKHDEATIGQFDEVFEAGGFSIRSTFPLLKVLTDQGKIEMVQWGVYRITDLGRRTLEGPQ